MRTAMSHGTEELRMEDIPELDSGSGEGLPCNAGIRDSTVHQFLDPDVLDMDLTKPSVLTDASPSPRKDSTFCGAVDERAKDEVGD